ncbi:hypothetical protein EV683_10764 [Crenobacter luteus]|uniref:Uncharacterized protein n=1 Tax=Crenobacter luteus TaxID=1452487 RepID=A0A163CZ57_9NEIS|nr:hypothetical protein AVW16_08290 [Crenobacter luteus]TCP13039.1 hypothetical protein EV683_10764 [Crenobacter luteus]
MPARPSHRLAPPAAFAAPAACGLLLPGERKGQGLRARRALAAAFVVVLFTAPLSGRRFFVLNTLQRRRAAV